MKFVCFFFAVSVSAQTLSVLPQKVELTTPESRQQLIAESSANGFQQDWSRQSTWTSSNPSVAKVDGTGLVTPVSDGEAVVTAEREGRKASTQVVVRNSKAPFQWSFKNHVIPVLTKSGCNQGACHGALAGKNGFKLTLRGYDPDLDYDMLTRQSVGRRVSLADPSASLMLQKPTMGIPHGGGRRFTTDSLEYRIIAEWIANGA